jgi:hypothetical protein
MAEVTTTLIVDGIDVDVAAVPLATILTEMVEASGKVYGSYIRIAAKFNELMPFAWYDIDHSEKSDNNKTLKGHKKPLYDALKLAGHTNASVPYGRMCDYARNMRNGLAPNGKTTLDGTPVEGEGEGDGAGAGPAPRSAMLRNIEELTSLYKFNDKQGADLPAKVKDAQKHITAALKALGIDVAAIA